MPRLPAHKKPSEITRLLPPDLRRALIYSFSQTLANPMALLVAAESANALSMTPRPLSQFQKQIVTTDAIIHYIVGYNPRLIRPPYGDITEEQLQWAKKQGCKIVNWNVDSLDCYISIPPKTGYDYTTLHNRFLFYSEKRWMPSMRWMFHSPGVQVVAFEPSVGPVPPPISVVIPEDD